MGRGGSLKGVMLFGLFLLTCTPLTGCGGGGGSSENKELKVGAATGWDEIGRGGGRFVRVTPLVRLGP